MFKLLLALTIATAFPIVANSAEEDLSLICKGATFESIHEKGKKTKYLKPTPTEKTFHIRSRVLQPDIPCKTWTDDKIFCTNEGDMLQRLSEICLLKSNDVTCLKIDRVTGDAFEQNQRKEGNRTTKSDFSGKCAKLTGRKF